MLEATVVIPTVGDRPAMLERVCEALSELGERIEVIVLEGCTWGAGVNAGVAQARAPRIVTLCDDTIPKPGWLEAALDIFASGLTPQAHFFDVDDEPLTVHDAIDAGQPSHWTRLFVLDKNLHQQLGPLLDSTWYVDWDYSRRLIEAGRPIVGCPGFAVTHLDGPRDWQRDGVLEAEHALYLRSAE